MTLRIAVPNKGRLERPAADLLRQSGMRYEKTDRSLSVPVRNIDIELLFVRVERGVRIVQPYVNEERVVLVSVDEADRFVDDALR